MREAAVGSSPEGDLIILRFDPAATKRVEACVPLFRDHKLAPATVAGAGAAWTEHDGVLAIAPEYEVKAAKDGESAEIIARGDLNGDGKTSRFKLLVKIDRAKQNELFVSPTIEATDPQE